MLLYFIQMDLIKLKVFFYIFREHLNAAVFYIKQAALANEKITLMVVFKWSNLELLLTFSNNRLMSNV